MFVAVVYASREAAFIISKFSSMYHNRCVSLSGQMFFPLCVAILLSKTTDLLGHSICLSFLRHMSSPLIKGWCIARSHCNMHATSLRPEDTAAPWAWEVSCPHAIPVSLEAKSTADVCHIQFCIVKRQRGRENCTMVKLSLSACKPCMQQYIKQYAIPQTIWHLMWPWKSLGYVYVL